jgi:hypothetical protein
LAAVADAAAVVGVDPAVVVVVGEPELLEVVVVVDVVDELEQAARASDPTTTRAPALHRRVVIAAPVVARILPAPTGRTPVRRWP